MKSGILMACILTICAYTAIAQKGLYFSPVFKNGISSSQQTNINPSGYTANPVYTYGAALGLGYSFNKIRVQADIGYQRSGYSYDLPSLNISQKLNQYINHVSAGLQLGYVLRNNKRLAIVPSLGAAYSINYSSRTVNKLNDGSILKKKTTQSIHKQQFEQGSILATTNVHFEYRFAQNAAFIFGPSFQYMITDMTKTNVLLTGASELKNHNAFIDIGIVWIFPDKSKAGKNRMPSLFYN